ncbi:MAG: alpha-hydroxy acid oxidase [Planctomycetaceae bacterium]
MNRRDFTQYVAMGAGSLPMLGANLPEALADDGPVDDASQAPAQRKPPKRVEPVNVADFERLAHTRLPKPTFDYISTGSADGWTLRENVAAFQRIRVLPPLLRGVGKTDLSTTVLNQRISLPIMLAPVAAQRMYHPQGPLAAARGAKSAGTVFGVSSSAGNSVEEIARASSGPKWFQLYVPKDRKIARRLVRRVEKAGYRAIILTVDLGEWKDADRRNRFMLPKKMLVKHLRDVGFAVSDRMSYEKLIEFNANAWDLALSWDFFGWLRSITKLPLVIKGVLRKDDAKKAVSLGLDGIVVSNHGGRRLDGMPATIDMLPEIVDAVAGKAEVYMDGGIRRGTDVLKALALGAKAVLIGRPYAWALGADGERGVRTVIELLRAELENAMIAGGCANLSDVGPSLVLKPR